MTKFALDPFPDPLKDQIIPWIKCVNGHQTDLSTQRNVTKLILSLGHPVDEYIQQDAPLREITKRTNQPE